MQRTISAMVGKGSVNHNSRKFHAKNTDPNRTENNIEYCNEPIREVYHKLFDEALKQYNEKQTRADRVIPDYYEKIRSSKQEKPFHELILQIGDKDNMSATTEDGARAKEILDDYYRDFQVRNPNLYVFSAHLHMDEATPHLHIDFVPFIKNKNSFHDVNMKYVSQDSNINNRRRSRLDIIRTNIENNCLNLNEPKLFYSEKFKAMIRKGNIH